MHLKCKIKVGLPLFLLVSIFSGADMTPESLIGSSMVNPAIKINVFDFGKHENENMLREP